MSNNKQLQAAVKRALADFRDKQVGKALDGMRKDIAVRKSESSTSFAHVPGRRSTCASRARARRSG